MCTYSSHSTLTDKPYVGLMLARRLRRRAHIKPAQGQQGEPYHPAHWGE